MRARVLSIKITEAEADQLKQISIQSNRSVSDICRDKIFKENPTYKIKLLEEKLESLHMDLNKYFYDLSIKNNNHFNKTELFQDLYQHLFIDFFIDMLSILNFAILKENSNINKEVIKPKLLDPPKYLEEKIDQIKSNLKRRNLNDVKSNS